MSSLRMVLIEVYFYLLSLLVCDTVIGYRIRDEVHAESLECRFIYFEAAGGKSHYLKWRLDITDDSYTLKSIWQEGIRSRGYSENSKIDTLAFFRNGTNSSKFYLGYARESDSCLQVLTVGQSEYQLDYKDVSILYPRDPKCLLFELVDGVDEDGVIELKTTVGEEEYLLVRSGSSDVTQLVKQKNAGGEVLHVKKDECAAALAPMA
eukprot:TRINITY_DN16346_c0_g1_i1.p1 TRINITY_DN16346_c0_g1~~TRINITY_DN16346_c0_g1_i1.p1  ORF type:complete len:220 (+),score=5.33 TRINITY_DN16346_c0_g1_i1:41-661(+)